MKSGCIIQLTEKKNEKFAFVSVRVLVPVKRIFQVTNGTFRLHRVYKTALFKSLKIAEEHNVPI